MNNHDFVLLRRPELLGELDSLKSGLFGLAELLDQAEEAPAPHTMAALIHAVGNQMEQVVEKLTKEV